MLYFLVRCAKLICSTRLVSLFFFCDSETAKLWARTLSEAINTFMVCILNARGVLPWTKKKKNHPGDSSCDIEESAVWFRHDALMREVAAVASRVRSRFRSWIKHLDSSISQDSDFMHQQHGSFLSRVVDLRMHCFLCMTQGLGCLLWWRALRSNPGPAHWPCWLSHSPLLLMLAHICTERSVQMGLHSCLSAYCCCCLPAPSCVKALHRGRGGGGGTPAAYLSF